MAKMNLPEEIDINSPHDIQDLALYISLARDHFDEYLSTDNDIVKAAYPSLIKQHIKGALTTLVALQLRLREPWYKKLYRKFKRRDK
jgi:hypothetical protein